MDTNKRPDNMQRIVAPEQARAFIDEQVEAVRAQVGDGKVLLALSGGVDSSVVAALRIRAIGKQLVCVHVNHGLMRKGESEQVVDVFQNQLDANLVYVDATDRFLGLLDGVAEPEAKRKIIGAEFIRVFEEEGCPRAWWSASRSPAPAWACAASAPSRATAWRRCARPTPSCARSSPRQGLRARCGSTS